MFPMYLHTSCFRESGWRTVLSEVEILAAGYVTKVVGIWELEELGLMGGWLSGEIRSVAM
jgi:hypothetical protein